MDVHLRLLRYFVAVAEDLNFTAASRRLHVSQPALSRQIRQLEQELNAELFDRHPRGVRLTDAGQLLLSQVPPILQQWNRTRTALRAAAAAEATSLRIGFTAANTTGLVRPAITEFGRRHAGWRMIMVQASWADPTGLLRSGETDVAFLRHPIPDGDRLDHLDVHTEARVLALPSDHRLADAASVDLSDVVDETFVPLPAGPWRDYWLCLDQRDVRDVRLTDPVTGPEEWSAAISAGHGMAVTAASAATYYARPGIAFRPLTGVGPTVIALVWRRDDRRTKTQDFVQACRTALNGKAASAEATGTAPPPVSPAVAHDLSRPARALRFIVSSEPDPLQEGLLAAFRARPDVGAAAVSATDSTSSRVEALLDGSADIAFVRLAESPHPDLGYQHLRTDPLLLALPQQHPLMSSTTEGPLPLPVLDDLPLAFYHRPQNPWWHDDVMRVFADHHLKPKIVYRGLWVYELLPLVRAGHAAALISTTAAVSVALPGTVLAPIRPAPTLSLGILWRNDVPPRDLNCLRTLAEALTSTVS